MVAWEVTRRCNLACVHCRASSERGPYPGELTTDEGLRLLDDIAAFSRPVIILTGGEPLLREDVLRLAAYGTKKGLRMVLATNGTLVTEDAARRMIGAASSGSASASTGPTREPRRFRCVPGAFAGAMAGIEAMKRAGLEFQINTTITRANLAAIGRILDLAVRIGAAAHTSSSSSRQGGAGDGRPGHLGGRVRGHPEVVRRTGASGAHPAQGHLRSPLFPGRAPAKEADGGDEDSGSAGGTRRCTFGRWIGSPGPPPPRPDPGCLGGSAFCFISHTGQVQPCGYLEVDCGRVRERGFEAVWKESTVFRTCGI